MTRFEEQLKEALARKAPSQDFANRVLERTREQYQHVPPVKRRWSFGRTLSGRTWSWRLAPVMAALVLVGGGAIYREHERTIRGEMAKESLLIAMRIAGSKLHDAKQHVLDIQYGGVER